MLLNQFRKRITTGTTLPGVTTRIVNQGCSVVQIYIAIAAPGSAWKLRIQDAGSPIFILVPDIILAAQAFADLEPIKFDEPIFMDGAVDIVTSGTTAGVVAVWVTALVNN